MRERHATRATTAGEGVPNGWKVVKHLPRKPNATGGHCSTGYVVENKDGRKGYLKAMDYFEAFQQPNTAELLKRMTEAYLFEKSVCERCKDRAIRRVVHAIDSGTIQAESGNPYSKVEYLIFDLADGDIRAHLDAQQKFDVAFALRTLHNVSVGLEQLHRADMAHQDLKPSNVLVFERDGVSKIADLGRAWCKTQPSPYDDRNIPGDTTHSALELLYGEISSDARTRRFGSDMYNLGSLAVFFFTRMHLNGLLGMHLAPSHQPFSWGGSYATVLPYIEAAFAEALNDFASHVPDFLEGDMRQIVCQLCDPNPATRGHPLNRQGHVEQLSLERYISWFNLLAARAERALNQREVAMPGMNEDRARQVVPRWRSFSDTVLYGELASLKPLPGPRFTDEMLAKLLDEWKERQTLSVATDLVSSAIILGRHSVARDAAEFILSLEAAPHAARQAALAYLQRAQSTQAVAQT